MQHTKQRPLLNWATATLFVLFQFFLQASAGVMAEKWQADFVITSTQIGLLSGSFFISYVIMQIPVGLAFDRFGPRRVLVFATLVIGGSSVLLGGSESFSQALLARIGLGIGSSFGFVGLLYVTAAWFSSRHFTVLVGLSETLGMLGVALGEVLLSASIERAGWRAVMLLASGVAFALCVAAYYLVHIPTKKVLPITSKPQPILVCIKQVMTLPQIWLAGLYGFASFSIVTVIANLWGIPLLMNGGAKMNLSEAGAAISMVYVGVAIGGPMNAWVAQTRHIRKQLMIAYAFLMTALTAVLLLNTHVSKWLFYSLFFFMGYFSSTYILAFEVVKEAVSESQRGTALATVNMLVMLSAPLMQPLIGEMLHKGYSYTQAMSMILVPMIAMCMSAWGLNSQKVGYKLKKMEGIKTQNQIKRKK